MGPGYHNHDRSFAMNFIFTSFLLLFSIPIWIQVVTICNRLCLYKWFNVVFKKLYCTLQVVYGLYWLARECHRLHTPECRLKKTAPRPCQQPMQTLPPLDEYIPALMTRLILIHYVEESPLLTPSTPQRILAPHQDQAAEEPEIGASQEPLTSIEDWYSDSETPIHQVQPVLGTTPTENLQLRDRNRSEDIADILGTTAFKGYVHTPIQTLNGIYVQQPKWFLPLGEEAK